jgi:hypothetical protein
MDTPRGVTIRIGYSSDTRIHYFNGISFDKVRIRVSDTYCIEYSYPYSCNIAEIHRVIAEEVVGASCHRVARRTPNHPYLARQLSDGEIWTAHGGVNPCGLFVRRGDQELRTRWLC